MSRHNTSGNALSLWFVRLARNSGADRPRHASCSMASFGFFILALLGVTCQKNLAPGRPCTNVLIAGPSLHFGRKFSPSSPAKQTLSPSVWTVPTFAFISVRLAAKGARGPGHRPQSWWADNQDSCCRRRPGEPHSPKTYWWPSP